MTRPVKRGAPASIDARHRAGGRDVQIQNRLAYRRQIVRRREHQRRSTARAPRLLARARVFAQSPRDQRHPRAHYFIAPTRLSRRVSRRGIDEVKERRPSELGARGERAVARVDQQFDHTRVPREKPERGVRDERVSLRDVSVGARRARQRLDDVGASRATRVSQRRSVRFVRARVDVRAHLSNHKIDEFYALSSIYGVHERRSPDVVSRVGERARVSKKVSSTDERRRVRARRPRVSPQVHLHPVSKRRHGESTSNR